ncbi:helix-hairpin-helix domain-containing protein [Thalassotalea sp. LPB0316]|uniref:ComEA family DNA-binding protein n=1 Tax=Thalassotalea sp. LPB0316 TaxID=2769490 RepID=UPI001866895E|nr:helix-hairpin-helix domain-containing protein [Thalassotalea sp. LPB0316]QOL24798.1 helix-hairpin-helix domain-containing protein [Thalassotalea sp. LPB0316]
MLKHVLSASLILLASLSTFAVADSVKPEPVVNSSDSLTLININQADVQALSSLKGIGKSKAQAIVEYREQHGQFNTLNELLKVKGIGAKVLSANAGKMTI